MISFLFQILIITGKPFKKSKENFWTLLYELFNSVYIYLLYCLTDFNDYRDSISTALVALICIVVAINLLKTLIKGLRWIKGKFTKKNKKNDLK